MTDSRHPQTPTGYDVIGDIHGFAAPLRKLLEELGYQMEDGAYRHEAGRQVVFLGDFIDRGPEIRETLHLVKGMVDSGSAVAVMGNHEFNAVCFHTPDGKGDFLRSRAGHDGRNVIQHQATLDAFSGFEEEWEDWIAWF
ncbi:MAG: metallophosphoesterase, partial [Verrucomicrobiae bacterium]|nr:metallophosphoesterase [Verrucomicrobiae bacterium]